MFCISLDFSTRLLHQEDGPRSEGRELTFTETHALQETSDTPSIHSLQSVKYCHPHFTGETFKDPHTPADPGDRPWTLS